MDPELDGSYPMRNHHGLRGGLIFMGIWIGAMSLTTSAGGGIAIAASASADRTVVTVAVDDAGVQAAPILAAPAAPAVVVAFPEDEAEPVSDPEPVRPVIQAGPGPATPVEGATTLIDPLVIER